MPPPLPSMKHSPLAIFLASMLPATLAFSQSTYDIGNGGNWSNAATWNPAIPGGPLPSDSVSIQNIPGSRSITLDGTGTLTYLIQNLAYNETDTVTFGGSSKSLVVQDNLTKSGAGSLVFQQINVTLGSLVVDGGTLTFGTGGGSIGTINVLGDATIASGATLQFAAGGTERFGRTRLDGAFTIGTPTASAGGSKTLTFAGLTGAGSISVPVDYSSTGTTTINFTPTSGFSEYTGTLSQGAANHIIALRHQGAGVQVLSGTTSYSGKTQIFGNGVLVFSGASTIGSGNIEISSNDSVTGGGILGLGNGDLSRTLGVGDGQIRLTGSNANGAGFAAYGADRTVTFDGGAAVTWGTSTFLSSGFLVLGHESATHTLIMANDFILGGSSRQIFTGDGTAAVDGRMNGVLSGTNGGITKTGAGTLELAGVNTYTGITTVNDGTLLLTGSIAASSVTVNGANSHLVQAGGAGSIARLTLNNGGSATLSGINDYGLDTTVNLGSSLLLDFSVAGAPENNILNNLTNGSALKLSGGTAGVKLSSGATANTQRFNGVTLGAATSSKFQVTQNGNTNASSGISLGAITRNANSTIDFTLPTTGTITTTTTSLTGTNKVLTNGNNGAAYATASQQDWVTNNSGTLGTTAGLYQVDQFVAGGDTDVTTDQAPASAFTVNTLRFNTAEVDLTLSSTGQNLITTGGILVTANGSGSAIRSTGGGITAGTGNELVIHNYGNFEINAPIVNRTSSVTNVTLAGTGVTTLSGANTYTGATVAVSGTTLLTGSLTDTAIAVNNTGTVFSQSQGSVIQGTKGVTVNSGTMTLLGDNLYTGVTAINGGVLEADSLANGGTASSIGSSASTAGNLLLSGGTLRYIGAAATTDRIFTLGGSAGTTGTLDASGTGAINFASTASILYGTTNQSRILNLTGTNQGDNILAATIADNGTGKIGLNKNGSGRWILSGNNTLTGAFTINDGILALGSTGALGTSGSIYLNGGTLQYTSANTTDYSARFNGASTSYRIDTNGQNVTFASVLAGNASSLVKLGDGLLSLNAANTYGGGTSLLGGTLSLGNSAALGTSGTISFGGGTLQYTSANTADYSARFSTAPSQAYRIDTNGQNVTYATVLTSAGGSLAKLGAGSLTLTNASAYTGATDVYAGTLVLGVNGWLGTSSGVNVYAGATLDTSAKTLGTTVQRLTGGGSVQGLASRALTVTSLLSAGDNGVGTLTITAGDLSLASGTTINYDISGSGSDLIRLTGSGSTVSLTGNYTIKLFDLGVIDPTSMTFVIFDAEAAIASTGNWTLDYGTTSWSGGSVTVDSLDNTKLILTGLTAVPEPQTMVLLAFGLIAVLFLRRRAVRP